MMSSRRRRHGAGLSAAGPRLTDGNLVLKLERGGAAAQFRFEVGGAFEFGDGVLAQHDLLAEPRAFVAGLWAARALAVRGGGALGRAAVGRR